MGAKDEADEGKRKDLLSNEERQELKALRGEVRELRRANDILKSASAFFAADSTHAERGERVRRRVPRPLRGRANLGRTLKMSASAYYERRRGCRSARAISDERLLACIREVHEANYCAYGYRRMWIALRRRGEEVGRGRVQRLMKAAGIQGAKRRGKAWRTTTPDPAAHRRPDLVQRQRRRPDRLWVGDFTYLRSWEGVSYFAFVIDAFSRRVVGWQLASHMLTAIFSEGEEERRAA